MRPHSIPTGCDEIICHDPATGGETGRVPIATATDVRAAVNRARAAQAGWARLSYPERAQFILRAREIVLSHIDDIATLIARETGKPAPEAMSMEVVPTLDLMHYFAKSTAKLLTNPYQYWAVWFDGTFFPHCLQTHRRGRNHFSLELPMGHSTRRSSHGIDGRQWRGRETK